MLDLNDVSMYDTKCLVTKNEDYWLWNRYLEHVHFDLINNIAYKNLVGLQKIKFLKDKLCDAFQMRKKMRVFFKSKKCDFNFKTS